MKKVELFQRDGNTINMVMGRNPATDCNNILMYGGELCVPLPSIWNVCMSMESPQAIIIAVHYLLDSLRRNSL